MSGVYSLAATFDITFILPKRDLKKSTKNQLNFSSSIFCPVWKTEQLFIIFFLLSFRKGLYKSVLLSSKNVAFTNPTSLVIDKIVF